MSESKILSQINKIIREQFPEFKGIEPKVIKKRITPQKSVFKKLSMGVPDKAKTFLSFHYVKKVKTVDSIVMKQILIITTDERGKIVKVSQSK